MDRVAGEGVREIDVCVYRPESGEVCEEESMYHMDSSTNLQMKKGSDEIAFACRLGLVKIDRIKGTYTKEVLLKAGIQLQSLFATAL